ncbi:MAG: acyl-CoA thioesterase [Spirochaetaceae bacterium]|jgi:acyl-CoA thioester hydrolase|nr:acyl-CoA thioesterase [Spirochaetaceae bacterium]
MFSTKVSPRFGNVDGLGHINNVVLAEWFELGRNPLFRIFSPSLSLCREDWPLIMAHAEYDFTDQIFFAFEVEILTFIERIGTKSFTIGHEAWQEGRLCATGKAVIVHYDFVRGQTTPIPEDKRLLLEEHLRAPQELA